MSTREREVIPPLVGTKEAAEILGWDPRRVSTYLSRGSFPKPVATLAMGPIWTRRQIIEYKAALERKAALRETVREARRELKELEGGVHE